MHSTKKESKFWLHETQGVIKRKTMKALGKLKKEEGVTLYDAPLPEIGKDDVLIKIKKTSICGTDLHIYNWDEWAQQTIPVPMTIGHEFVGTITRVGENVKNLNINDRVSGEGHIICRHCRSCRSEKPHHCPNTLGLGVNRTGCFAEYLSLPASNVIKIPDTINDDIASILDPLGNAVHTALSFRLLGEDVLITGAGPIGIMAADIAHFIGAKNIVLTEINPNRLELARESKAMRVVDVLNQNLEDVLEELKIQDGFTMGLEMSGNANAFNQMIDTMAPGGKIALLGILPNGAGINWANVIFKSLFIKAIYGREIFKTWYKMIDLIEDGLDVSHVITNHFKVDDYQKAFDVMKTGNSGKIILEW